MTNAHWQQAIQKLLAEAPAGSYGQSSELTPQIRALLPSGSMYEAASPADIRGERSDWLHIDARGFDDDQLYEALEHSIFYAQAVWISECENAAGKCLAIAYIIHKYRMLIGSAAQYPSSGHCFITLSDGVKSKTGAASHRELAGEYDSAYYLKDCGGYETFISGQGQKLDDRLRGLMRLVQSGPHASALDIGCGRGELACALYKAGASVLAVDYSEDAIRLAEKTYEAYICERLQYLNINVLDLPETQKFDCIVMSDVVEHIEDASLRLIFAKIARLLSPSGRLIIHTAPNKLVYTLDYPKRREAARNIGLFLPPNPRSYYEERMHINEQTPDSLENALKSCFAHVIVWTGIAASVLRRDGAPGEPHDMSIYAMASNEPISREALSELLDNRLDQSLVNVALECEEQAVTAAAGAEITLRLSLKNLGAQALSSDLPYPAHVTYHIFDQGGNVVVHDGVRTQLPNPLEPGAQAQVSARVLLPADLKGGRAYSIGVTLVQEGRFWFDTLSERFITHIPLTAIE